MTFVSQKTESFSLPTNLSVVRANEVMRVSDDRVLNQLAGRRADGQWPPLIFWGFRAIGYALGPRRRLNETYSQVNSDFIEQKEVEK